MGDNGRSGFSAGLDYSSAKKPGTPYWKHKGNRGGHGQQHTTGQGLYPTSSTISRGIGPLVQSQEPVDPAAIDNAPVLQPDAVALISKGGLAGQKKSRKPVLFLRAEQITDKSQGLHLLYRVVSKQTEELLFKCSNGSLDRALKDYVGIVKEWGFNLAPKYSFDYLLDRVQALGRKKELADELIGLRNVQQGKMVANLETNEFDKVQVSSSAGQVKLETLQSNPPQLRLTVDQGPVVVDAQTVTKVKLSAPDA